LPLADAPAAALLDVRAVAALLDCSPRHVYRLSDSGRLPAPVRLGALVRWRRADLDRWLADGCRPVRQPSREPPCIRTICPRPAAPVDRRARRLCWLHACAVYWLGRRLAMSNVTDRVTELQQRFLFDQLKRHGPGGLRLPGPH